MPEAVSLQVIMRVLYIFYAGRENARIAFAVSCEVSFLHQMGFAQG